MKEQYVGDIGDFGKVLLLKHLAQLGFKIGINWVLTEADDGTDGRHRDYPWYGIRHAVNNPLYPRMRERDDRRNCLACCTDEQVLKEIAPCAAKPVGDRKIQHLERTIVETLPRKTDFFREVYRDGDDRNAKNNSALRELADADLVFFDPDNGIKLQKSLHTKSPKHVYTDELLAFWENRKSLLVYHHWGRPAGGNLPVIEEIRSELKSQFPGSTALKCTFRRGSTRTYFLMLQREHRVQMPVGDLESVEGIRPLTFAMKEWRLMAHPCHSEHPWQFTPAAPPPPPSPPAPGRR
jgi:hypothetical protein